MTTNENLASARRSYEHGIIHFVLCDPEESYRTATPKPRLLDQVRGAIRARHMSPRTEEAYVHWIRRYILFHRKRHPAEMGPVEISQFLTALAVSAM